MYRRILAVVLVLTVAAVGRARAADAPSYYLALGDSLSVGVQPTASGTLVPTTQGYVDDLYALARLRDRGLRLAKLGCSGETTSTMIAGGACSYPLGSQLAQAIDFLSTHHVALITLTIGGDNIIRCVGVGGIDQTCVTNGIAAAAADLPQILAALRAAAGPAVPIIAMNYYDPFLGLWKFGAAGQVIAYQSLQISVYFNTVLEGIYGGFHVRVADVAGAYRITDFTPVPVLNVPLNVFVTLTWTWMNLNPPAGPDVHPNRIGYGVIAAAFVRAMGAQ